MSELEQLDPVPFEEFLSILVKKPSIVIRNIFQLFHDMVKSYVTPDIDESKKEVKTTEDFYYDCNRLLVEDTDHPFFADRLFAYRFIRHVESLKRGTQQNKIYIFRGPHGCGKSTFINNLLKKFEQYTHTECGLRFETVWRLDRNLLGTIFPPNVSAVSEKLVQRMQESFLEVPCPSHDNPILMIPKEHRRVFFDDLFENDEFKWKLNTEKEYEWVFKENPCTICSSLYQALLSRLKSPLLVFKAIYARPYKFNRRLGEGISVFNPGDSPLRQNVLRNPMIQRRINEILEDSNLVKYLYSQYARTNNGVYALMDIKSHNADRMRSLHNIISESVHKVENIEENVNSLLIAVMNPEDKRNIENFHSFSDRIEYINIPYVLDFRTEVEIYRNIFGKHIDNYFLPRVLHNFARVVIATRLNKKSEALLEWIEDPAKYILFCDGNLQLLKMEIYTGHMPPWISEEDSKRFTPKQRRKVLSESEQEGEKGFSGRDSIKIFNEFYSMFTKGNKLINMSMLRKYFDNCEKKLKDLIPEGFLDSLIQMYDYTILNEVKESLYYYNEEQISKDIQNYLFALNFETDAKVTSKFTGDKLEITEEFLRHIENRFLGQGAKVDQRLEFRQDTQKTYTSKTLTQEIVAEGKPVTETDLFQALHERYVYNLKEKVLDPFLENENFRRAIKDYGEEDFKTYDKRIQDDVTFLMENLCSKYGYTDKGAKEICIYVIDNELAAEFASPQE